MKKIMQISLQNELEMILYKQIEDNKEKSSKC